MYNAKMKINTVTVTTVPVTSVFYSWYVCFVSLESFLLSVFHQQVVTPCAFAIIHLLHYCLEKKSGCWKWYLWQNQAIQCSGQWVLVFMFMIRVLWDCGGSCFDFVIQGLHLPVSVKLDLLDLGECTFYSCKCLCLYQHGHQESQLFWFLSLQAASLSGALEKDPLQFVCSLFAN